jgi:hypothetical protein
MMNARIFQLRSLRMRGPLHWRLAPEAAADLGLLPLRAWMPRCAFDARLEKVNARRNARLLFLSAFNKRAEGSCAFGARLEAG